MVAEEVFWRQSGLHSFAIAQHVFVSPVVKGGIAEVMGVEHGAHEDQRGAGELRFAHLLGDGRERAADDHLVWPGDAVGDDEPERYLIGSIEERSDDVETLTVGSPLGQALLGAKVDDVVGFEAPGGVLNVRIVKIEV